MDSKQQEAAAAVVGTPSEDSISMKTEYNPAHEVFVSEPLPVSDSGEKTLIDIVEKNTVRYGS